MIERIGDFRRVPLRESGYLRRPEFDNHYGNCWEEPSGRLWLLQPNQGPFLMMYDPVLLKRAGNE